MNYNTGKASKDYHFRIPDTYDICNKLVPISVLNFNHVCRIVLSNIYFTSGELHSLGLTRHQFLLLYKVLRSRHPTVFKARYLDVMVEKRCKQDLGIDEFIFEESDDHDYATLFSLCYNRKLYCKKLKIDKQHGGGIKRINTLPFERCWPVFSLVSILRNLAAHCPFCKKIAGLRKAFRVELLKKTPKIVNEEERIMNLKGIAIRETVTYFANKKRLEQHKEMYEMWQMEKEDEQSRMAQEFEYAEKYRIAQIKAIRAMNKARDNAFQAQRSAAQRAKIEEYEAMQAVKKAAKVALKARMKLENKSALIITRAVRRIVAIKRRISRIRTAKLKRKSDTPDFIDAMTELQHRQPKRLAGPGSFTVRISVRMASRLAMLHRARREAEEEIVRIREQAEAERKQAEEDAKKAIELANNPPKEAEAKKLRLIRLKQDTSAAEKRFLKNGFRCSISTSGRYYDIDSVASFLDRMNVQWTEENSKEAVIYYNFKKVSDVADFDGKEVYLGR
jgi:hypothetical protein